MLQAASLLAERIRAEAVEHPDGRITWPTAAAYEVASASVSSSTPAADGIWDLYSGNPGIALFLAAYSHITGDVFYRDLCLRALGPLRSPARFPRDIEAMTIGALVGTGSWIYSLLVAGRLLREPSLIEEAHVLSSLITPERIGADRHLDLAFGSSGALLVLLALDHEIAAPNPAGYTALELACLCAANLTQENLQNRMVLSRNEPGRRLGLSHGLAGIGLALSRLYRRTRAAEAARAAHDVFSLLLHFGSDYGLETATPDRPDPAHASWCHGIPGLCIAFTAYQEDGLAANASNSSTDAWRMAIDWTQKARHSPHDHLCCGNMGRVAALAYASRKAADAKLSEAALRLAALVLRVAKTRKRFSFEYPELHDSSLFRGYAGVAYTLLALSHQDLPHILALE